MVGRNKRPLLTTTKKTQLATEDDIVCLDIPVKQSRKSTPATKLSAKKKFEEKINEFEGFDVEDATEDEKRQIREAILASTKEQQELNFKQDFKDLSGTELDSNSCEKTENLSIDDIEINSEEDQPFEDSTHTRNNKPESTEQYVSDDQQAVHDDDDDDETQPPSDMEENDFVLNLNQPTIDNSREDLSETDSKSVDVDTTLKGDGSIEDPEEFEEDKNVDKITLISGRNKNVYQESYEMENQEDVTMTETVAGKMQGESEGFDALMDKYYNNGGIKFMENQSEMSQPPEYSYRAGRSGSLESLLHTKSKCKGNSSCEKSTSQGSFDFVKGAVTSPRSNSSSRTPSRQSSRSNSQNGKNETEHIPLTRHYRGVLQQYRNLKHDDYLGTSGSEELEKSAMAIYQLFEIYRTKLKNSQRKLCERVTWPEPVKTGQHQSKTLDIKRRGKESIFIDMSDLEEDFQDQKVGRDYEKRKIINMDEEKLPEIVIESDNSNDSVTNERSARNPKKSSTVENDIMSAETQPYDVDNNDSEDFAVEIKTRARGRPRAGTSKENLRGKKFDVVEKENKVRPTRGRPSKRFGLNRQKFASKILVAETQPEEMDLQDTLKISEPGLQVSVKETQPQDEDFDWLTVGNTCEKEEFENQLHRHDRQKFSNQKPHQMYAKSHQKVIFKDKNVQKDNLENSSEENFKDVSDNVKDFKSAVRGRKRKAKKQPVVTLVEETQDLDAEGDWNKSHGKRKRNCFRLESGSEEESIAESQDIDKLSECGLEEITEANRGLDKTNIDNQEDMHSTMINSKEFASPEKVEGFEYEGSQSPIISKKKTYGTVQKKVYAKPNIRTKSECEKEPFKKYGANSMEKRFKDANSSNFAHINRIHPSFSESSLQEEITMPDGAKRFINRPSSKDSNASDNISTTSSQMSTNMLDEKGDLYSTQFCEIRARKGKSFQSIEQSKHKIEDPYEEILTLDDSEDDIPVLKEPKKTYTVKRFSKNLPVTKDVQKSGKRDKKVYRMKNIQKYFDTVKQPGDGDTPIELDIDSDEETDGEQGHNEHIQAGSIDHLVEPAMSEYKNVSNKESKQRILRSPIISISDVATELEEEKIKADINHKLASASSPKHQDIDTDTDMTDHFNFKAEDQKDLLNDLDNVLLKKRHKGNKNNCNSKHRSRNIEIDSELFEMKLTRNRRRKVSETISSAEYEERTCKPNKVRVGDQNIHEEMSQGRNDARKRGREPVRLDENLAIKKKIEKVECPICSRLFPVTLIEEHAATCEGLVDEEEVDGMLNNEEEYIENICEHHPDVTEDELIDALSQRHHHHHLHHEEQNTYHHHKKMSVDDQYSPHQQDMYLHDQDHHLDHTNALYAHSKSSSQALHRQESVDEKVIHFMQNDEHVKDVAKNLNSSPGEEGELQSCYICDGQVLKGKPFEIHMSRCLAIAAQQQAEVDEKGFSNVYAKAEPEEEVQVRTLRGRQINNDQVNTPVRGVTLRGRQLADNSPGDARWQKQEICVETGIEGDSKEDNQQILRSDREAGAIKRGLTKRVNKKIIQSDDGSGCYGRH